MSISLLIEYQQTDMQARTNGEKQKNTLNTFPAISMMKRVMQLFRDRLDEQLRPYGVTAAQLHILATLDLEPGISGAHLARHCRVTPQTTQVLLRTIEANGWIERRRHPENDRILLVTLTSSGKRMLTRSRKAVGQLYSAMLEGFAHKDAAALEQLLARCVANLEDAVAPNPRMSAGPRSRPANPRIVSRLGVSALNKSWPLQNH